MTGLRPALLLVVLSCLSAPVSAQSGPAIAFSTADLNMRAGPGTNYPVITTLPRGSAVTVFGCTADFRWCDAAFVNVKGWVSGKYLSYAGNGAYYGRPLPNAGGYLGVPRYSQNYPVYRLPPPPPPAVVMPYPHQPYRRW